MILLRHGEPDYNNPVHPLTEKGREQAAAMGLGLRGLGILTPNTSILASPKLRAIETASIIAIAANAKVSYDAALDEEYCAQIIAEHGETEGYRLYGQEILRNVVIAEQDVAENGTLLVVAHTRTIKGLVRAMLDYDMRPEDAMLAHGAAISIDPSAGTIDGSINLLEREWTI